MRHSPCPTPQVIIQKYYDDLKKNSKITVDITENYIKDITEKLKEAIKQDVVSSAIPTKLADVLNGTCSQKVGNIKTVNAIIEKAHRPENCEFFVPPCINKRLYTYLKKEATDQAG